MRVIYVGISGYDHHSNYGSQPDMAVTLIVLMRGIKCTVDVSQRLAMFQYLIVITTVSMKGLRFPI